jgi:hypothetical protein
MAKKQPVKLDKIPKAEARVLIAKDVIKQLKAKKLRALSGTYVRVRQNRGGKLFRDQDVEDGLDVRDVLRQRAKQCDVCAKGAILIATIMKFDNMPVMPEFLSSDAFDVLGMVACGNRYDGFFSQGQLDQIERAFENPELDDCVTLNPLMVKYPRGKRDGDHNRLIAIMENIIDNGGTFKPAKLSKQLAE